MIWRAPLVCNAPHTAVERERQLENVLSVDLVECTRGCGLHARLGGPTYMCGVWVSRAVRVYRRTVRIAVVSTGVWGGHHAQRHRCL